MRKVGAGPEKIPQYRITQPRPQAPTWWAKEHEEGWTLWRRLTRRGGKMLCKHGILFPQVGAPSCAGRFSFDRVRAESSGEREAFENLQGELEAVLKQHIQQLDSHGPDANHER